MIISVSPVDQETHRSDHPQWHPATWEDYLSYRDAAASQRLKLFFNQGYLFVDDMGWEGINHAKVSDLFILLLGFWFMQQPEQVAESLGRCLLEKSNQRAASPDLVLYIGTGTPQWQQGEPRRIDLEQWRSPDLVGEISDTTLSTDLDEKKQLYAALGIPEYWVIDVWGQRVLAFCLQDHGAYQQCTHSVALAGLPIELLTQTLARLNQGTNISAAHWFAQQITHLHPE